MAKAKTAYVCAECGAHSVKWAGQCPDCAAWNTLTQIRIAASRPVRESKMVAATLESLPDDLAFRHETGFVEFDRVYQEKNPVSIMEFNNIYKPFLLKFVARAMDL